MIRVQGVPIDDEQWLTLQMLVVQTGLSIAVADGARDDAAFQELLELTASGKYDDPLEHAVMRTVAEDRVKILDGIERTGRTLGDGFSAARAVVTERFDEATAFRFLWFVVGVGRQVAVAPHGTGRMSSAREALLLKATELCFPPPEWLALETGLLRTLHAAAGARGDLDEAEFRRLMSWEGEEPCEEWVHLALLTSAVLDFDRWTNARVSDDRPLIDALEAASAVLTRRFGAEATHRFMTMVVARGVSIGTRAGVKGSAVRALVEPLRLPARLAFADDEWATLEEVVARVLLSLGEVADFGTDEFDEIGRLFEHPERYDDPVTRGVMESFAAHHRDIPRAAKADPRSLERYVVDAACIVARRFGTRLAERFTDHLVAITRTVALAPDGAGELTRSDVELLGRLSEGARAGTRIAQEVYGDRGGGPSWPAALERASKGGAGGSDPLDQTRRDEAARRKREREQRQRGMERYLQGTWKQDAAGALGAAYGIPTTIAGACRGDFVWQLADGGELTGTLSVRIGLLEAPSGVSTSTAQMRLDFEGRWSVHGDCVVFEGTGEMHTELDGLDSTVAPLGRTLSRRYRVKIQDRGRWEGIAEDDGSTHLFVRVP